MSDYSSVRIPADVERPDKVLANLTARQVAICAATFLLLYLGWVLARGHIPFGAYLMVAIPVAAGGLVLALARRDGISLDNFLRAALSFALRPRHHHNPDTHPGSSAGAGGPADGAQGVPGWVAARANATYRRPRSAPLTAGAVPVRGVSTPVHGPSDVGLLDLGGYGLVVVAACSVVNFALRTETEQAGLIDCFARMLHAQTGPLQILVRSHPVDLTPVLADLAHAATTLGHPALRGAAAGHHQWLTQLAHREGLSARQVLIVLREPVSRSHTTPTTAAAVAEGAPVSRAVAGAQARLVRRLADVRRALAPADITVTALAPAELEAVLATSADPARHLPSVPQPTIGPFATTARTTLTSGAAGAGWAGYS